MSAHTRPSTPGIWASGVAEMDAHAGWLVRRRPSAARNAIAVARREERLLLAWWVWRSRSDTADPFLVDRESLHDIEACSNGQRSPVATGDVFPPACDLGRPQTYGHMRKRDLEAPRSVARIAQRSLFRRGNLAAGARPGARGSRVAR